MKFTKSAAAPIMGLLLFAAGAPGAAAVRDLDQYILELSGIPCVLVYDVHGGEPIPEVVSEQVAGEPMPKKRIASIHYSEISFNVNRRACPAFNDWLRQSTSRPDGVKMDGSIVYIPGDGGPSERMNFLRAVLTEIQLPRVMPNDKSFQWTLSAKLKPEQTVKTTTSGHLPSIPVAGYLCGRNWHFDSSPLSGTYFDRIAVNWSPSSQPLEKPGPITVSDLSITVPEANAAPLYEWFDAFVVRGRNGDSSERFATLVCPSEGVSGALRVDLRHLGIVSVTKNSDELDRKWVTAKFYVESLQLDFSGE